MLTPADFSRFNELVVLAHVDLAEAVADLRQAQLVDQSIEDRKRAKASAMDKIECLKSHIFWASEAISEEMKIPVHEFDETDLANVKAAAASLSEVCDRLSLPLNSPYRVVLDSLQLTIKKHTQTQA